MAQWETSCAGTLCIRTCASRLMIRGQLQVKILPGGWGAAALQLIWSRGTQTAHISIPLLA